MVRYSPWYDVRDTLLYGAIAFRLAYHLIVRLSRYRLPPRVCHMRDHPDC